MPAIEIRGLRKVYRTGFWRNKEKVGLADLTLAVEQGEVFGCLGPNGAGLSANGRSPATESPP